MNLTKEKAIKEHRAMWLWIADRLENGYTKEVADLKAEYIEQMGLKGQIFNDCFCCEYAEGDCLECPVVWGSEGSARSFFCERDEVCSCAWSNAQYYSRLGAYKKAAEIARQIANLPEKE